jgi:hypothetical protein
MDLSDRIAAKLRRSGVIEEVFWLSGRRAVQPNAYIETPNF